MFFEVEERAEDVPDERQFLCFRPFFLFFFRTQNIHLLLFLNIIWLSLLDVLSVFFRQDYPDRFLYFIDFVAFIEFLVHDVVYCAVHNLQRTKFFL